MNGGLFNMRTGVPVFTYKDEGVIKSDSLYKMGFGVDKNGVMSIGMSTNNSFKDFISAYPYLISAKKKVKFTYGKEIEGNHPRTALGYNKDFYFFVIVDGRTKKNKGMEFEELQDLFISIGADYAMNLDGGGSTRVLENGIVKNQPTEDRPVDNVICAYLIKNDNLTNTESTVNYRIVNAPSGLRIRSNTDTNSKSNIITVLDNGTVVKVYEITNGWAKINYNNGNGYCSANYLSKI
jgi:hypothetical protein